MNRLARIALARSSRTLEDQRPAGRTTTGSGERVVVVAAVAAEPARGQALLGVVDAAAVVEPEIFHERAADAVARRRRRREHRSGSSPRPSSRWPDCTSIGSATRWRAASGEGRGSGVCGVDLRPHRLHDRFEDRQRDLAAGLAAAERALALGVVVADPDHDGDVVAEAGEPGVVEVVAGAGLAADVGRQRAQARRRAARHHALQERAELEHRRRIDARRAGAALRRPCRFRGRPA